MRFGEIVLSSVSKWVNHFLKFHVLTCFLSWIFLHLFFLPPLSSSEKSSDPKVVNSSTELGLVRTLVANELTTTLPVSLKSVPQEPLLESSNAVFKELIRLFFEMQDV